MRVLVTGATGAIGPDIVDALCRKGHLVFTLSLDRPVDGLFPEGVVSLVGDVTNRSTVALATKDVDAVIHMAALLHINDPPAALRRKYESVNVGGTECVVEAAAGANVERIVFFSTIAVYGSSIGTGNIYDELSPVNPGTMYGETKLAAEKIVLSAKRANGESMGAVMRLGAVYGSRVKGNYSRLVHALARNRFVSIGNGKNRRTLLYSADVGKAVVEVLEHPGAAGRIYNVSDGRFHTINEIIAAICAALGRKPPRFSLPVGPVRAAAGLAEDIAGIMRCRSPVTRSTIDKYTEDIAVSSERIRKELGFIPQYDLAAGWNETVREMRESGAL